MNHDEEEQKKGIGKRGPGKVTATVKENMLAVFNRLGGTAKMAEWAESNQTEFYKLYARLLPIEGPGDGGAHVFELKAPWIERVAKTRGWA